MEYVERADARLRAFLAELTKFYEADVESFRKLAADIKLLGAARQRENLATAVTRPRHRAERRIVMRHISRQSPSFHCETTTS
jgi:hypothetical protein